jgi:hypothetical protein
MRECFAVTFTMIATLFAMRRRFIGYLFFLLLAISFHQTAIVFLPLYWIINLPLKAKTIVPVAILFAVVNILSYPIFNYTRDLFGRNYEVASTMGFSIILYIFYVIVAYISFRKNTYYKYSRYWFWAVSLILCYISFARLNPAFFRVYIYFSIYTILLIPCICKIGLPYKKLVFYLALLYGIYNFTYGAKKAGIRVFPYVFYWEDYYEYNPDARSLQLN